MRHVNLLTIFGDKKGSKTIMIQYLLVNVLTSYNILIGCPALNELGAIISNPHLVMKLLSTSGQIIIVRADQVMTQECYIASLKIAKEKKVAKPKEQLISCTFLNNNLGKVEVYPGETVQRIKPAKEVKLFQLDK